MIIQIDTDRVVDGLLVGSALAAVGSGSERPIVFNPDHGPMLAAAVRDAFRMMALRLAPYITDIESDTDRPFIELDDDIRVGVPAVVEMVEMALAARVLQAMHLSGYPALAAEYGRRASQMEDMIERLLMGGAPAPGRIRPRA